MDRHQHRPFSYSVYIKKTNARLLRWDGSAVVVTRAFSYVHTPYLAEFLYRFSFFSPARRGFDIRFQPATEYDRELVRLHLKPQEGVPRRQVAVLTLPVLQASDNGTDTTADHEILAWHPVVNRNSMVGRGTRGFICWDKTAGCRVFYKDGRRPEKHIPEAHTLRILNKAGVEFVPTLLSGGDLDGSGGKTLNASLLGADWLPENAEYTKGIMERTFNSCLISEVCLPLYGFPTSRILLSATKDGYVGKSLLSVRVSCGDFVSPSAGMGALPANASRYQR